MSGILLILVGILYLLSSVTYFIHGHIGLGIAFLCYAISNYGLYLAGT